MGRHLRDKKFTIALANNVRAMRVSLGISQARIADALGIHDTAYGRYERGENGFTALVLLRISKALDVPLEQLFEGVECSVQPIKGGDKPIFVRLDY